MNYIPLAELYPGMIIAEDVYAPGSSQLLLPAGFVLTPKAIARLEFYSVFSVKITDGTKENTSKKSAFSTFSERVRKSDAFIKFSETYTQDINSFKLSLNKAVSRNKPLELEALLSDTFRLLQYENKRINLFDMLTNLRHLDDATYAHSINVALICNIFAGWLHYSEEDIQTATLCGLLHDIGKIMVPEHILTKKGKLTAQEYDIVKAHTVKGYQKLRDLQIDSTICNVALMHHERYDGSGYPLGLENEQINSFACLVGIADVYDAMTSARAYRDPICPFDVISLLETEGYQKYSPKYLLTFLENIVNSYLLNTVRLSDGREGTIVFINKDKLSCPTVKVGDGYVDLSKQTNLSIVKVI